MINLRNWLADMTDEQLVAFWEDKIIYNIGCDACPIDIKYCNKQGGTCDDVFLNWCKEKAE